MKTYVISFGNGTCSLSVKTISVEDFEGAQEALDKMADQMEIDGETGRFISDDKLACNGGEYYSDEYITCGNHGLNLYHGGMLDIILL